MIFGCQGFIQVFWEWGLFPKIGKNIGYLGMKIPGVSCRIWEFCMILKKFQLGKGPLFCPCRYSDNPLVAICLIHLQFVCNENI